MRDVNSRRGKERRKQAALSKDRSPPAPCEKEVRQPPTICQDNLEENLQRNPELNDTSEITALAKISLRLKVSNRKKCTCIQIDSVVKREDETNKLSRLKY
ncbi:unnamed protein product [Arctia plantaginis]|uniref:Uncharacterized protein n=1 Tax=Arctia plantaginis TaxID=874455 RepID=A0A8S1A0K8_ARCPL|nr:unnamed protein product [Arctia plantaginis]